MCNCNIKDISALVCFTYLCVYYLYDMYECMYIRLLREHMLFWWVVFHIIRIKHAQSNNIFFLY